MKLIVCESCEAEYKIKYDLNEMYYTMQYCTFCGAKLSDELEDEIEEWDEDEDECCVDNLHLLREHRDLHPINTTTTAVCTRVDS